MAQPERSPGFFDSASALLQPISVESQFRVDLIPHLGARVALEFRVRRFRIDSIGSRNQSFGRIVSDYRVSDSRSTE